MILCRMTYWMWFLQKIFQVAKGNFEGLDLKKPQLQTTNEIKAKQDTHPQRIRSSQHHGKVYIFVQHNLILKQKSFHIPSPWSRRNNTKAALYGSNFQVYIIACHVEDQLQSKQTDVRNISSSNLQFYVLTTDGDRGAKILSYNFRKI